MNCTVTTAKENGVTIGRVAWSRVLQTLTHSYEVKWFRAGEVTDSASPNTNATGVYEVFHVIENPQLSQGVEVRAILIIDNTVVRSEYAQCTLDTPSPTPEPTEPLPLDTPIIEWCQAYVKQQSTYLLDVFWSQPIVSNQTYQTWIYYVLTYEL